ncbi:rho-related BTB domain-containing protein 1 isoform X1 [Drosophila sulfurigaster albostrigata]|uniref:Rho-related BTB domain-containing protein 1 isoform X1 n=2 Tax=nasuta subgroup TaxID=32307 RepID=A0A6P8X5G8_DROAB|nr:rho-related BTB domain-containing protein 1 isoform X1 [Drosophila albomicans]XP_034111482.1 rho-related BTB domain-containing protein 1 isoform X1 [Drosophila albomicans]XP_062131741.1 rho-related BTB domain-containing protein 1 isoform X1 [Drosophila sulfurigaster albostrigata]
MPKMDNEQPHQELVKCVLVGDTAVGKTRLICARACNKHVSLSQLLSTHVPTVWAIDQYRIYKDVLERSWEVVDGVNVSLRLWDTFGDHDKDRRFAYGRSDVVLLCFSIASPISLRNCKVMWYPEIRRFCPDVPVVLVGCKNDLRYMYRDENYLSYFGEKGTFVRAALKSDLVMPDEARAVAKELGVSYYETSVFTYFGVNEVFENAIRSALIARRQQRFWMTNLKKVQKPLLQAPFRPPKPPPPEVTVMVGHYRQDIYNMFLSQAYADLILVAGGTKFAVHRFMLAAASSIFQRILTTELSDMGGRSSSESSMVSSTFGEATIADFNDDTEYLIRYETRTQRMWEHLKRRSSYQALPLVESKRSGDLHKDLQHPVLQSLRLVQVENQRGVSAIQTIVTLNKLISPQALHQCLRFIYTGTIDKECSNIQEIREAADFLELPQLTMLLTKPQSIMDSPSDEPNPHICLRIKESMERHCIGDGCFTDVTFELDDGLMKAHRAVLVGRCDVMRAMLLGDFREAHSNVIVFPGVTIYTFHKLLCYLYTDQIPPISAVKCLNLLELANRLCLPRLINLIECRVIEDLTIISQNETNETVDHCLKLLEPVKLHNAHQLAEWCMSYLCVNYNVICKFSLKGLKALHQDNQEYLREHRWPPVWYLKDYDYYQRCINELNKELKLKSSRRDFPSDDEGCLCFTGVFSWLLGKSKRNGVVTSSTTNGDSSGGTTAENQIFNSSANSMNHIDLEADIDLNL